MLSGIFNVLIVLIAIFIALSVLCSWIQEQIAAIFQLRSKTLLSGLEKLLADETNTIALVTSSPLIQAACSPNKRRPSYIEPRNFTLAFWQAVAKTSAAQTSAATLFANVVTAVNAMPAGDDAAGKLKSVATSLLNAAQGDYDKLLSATDAWFDAQMDRVSGWYKVSAQWILVGIAAVVCFGLGVDSLDIGRQLYNAPDLANGASAAIQQVVEKDKTANTGQATADIAQVVANSGGLAQIRLLRWWQSAPGPTPAPTPTTAPTNSGNGEDSIPLALFGMLLTTIAVALGAPFWFDVLQSIVNVRMAGVKPDPVSEPSGATSPST